MYEKRPQCFQVCLRFRLINLGRRGYSFPGPFDLSSRACWAYKMWNKSTKNNKHQVTSPVFRWILLFMSVFSKAIWPRVPGQKDEFYLKFLMFQRNKIHRQHVILHQEYLRMSHQSFYIWEHNQQLGRC